MLMLIKLADARGIHFVQILFARQFMTIPILLGYLAMRGQLSVMRTNRLGSHAGRAVSGTIAMVLTFAAPILLPLTVATTFGFTSPMFATILSALLLREHVGRWRWLATILGFGGVILVADPFNASVPLVGALVAIGSAMMIAFISIQIRDLTRTEDSLAIVCWFSIFASPFLLIALLFTSWDGGMTGLLLLAGIAISGLLGQILLTLSLRYGEVSSVIAMDYMMLLWATFYGWSIFDSLPPAGLWLGAPIVIASGAIIVWREQVLAKQRNEAVLR